MARRVRVLVVLAAAAMLPACATDLTQARSPCIREPGGWCGFTRDFAVRTWEYAQLSNNTYDDKDEMFAVLPDGITLVSNSGNDKSGFAYAIYDRKLDGKLAERIIAFRGTEFSFNDWFAGNIGGTHNQRGLETYQKTRAELDADGHADVPIRVTGHSLGGAIAAQISMTSDGVDSYAFNQSPKFDIPDVPANSERMAVTERGEGLGTVRELFRNAPQDVLVINCRPRGAPWSDHSVYRLAQCLTWIAAYADDNAYRSTQANAILKPWVECGERSDKHPGPMAGRTTAPCSHNTSFKEKKGRKSARTEAVAD